jgi:hypothetical protein
LSTITLFDGIVFTISDGRVARVLIAVHGSAHNPVRVQKERGYFWTMEARDRSARSSGSLLSGRRCV